MSPTCSVTSGEVHKDFRDLFKEISEFGFDFKKTKHGFVPVLGRLDAFSDVVLPFSSHTQKSWGRGANGPVAMKNKLLRIWEATSPGSYRASMAAHRMYTQPSTKPVLDAIGQELFQEDLESPERSARRPIDEGIIQVRTSSRRGGRRHKLYTTRNGGPLSTEEPRVRRLQIQEDGTEVEIGDWKPRKQLLRELLTELHDDGLPFNQVAKVMIGLDPNSYVEYGTWNDISKKRKLQSATARIRSFVNDGVGSTETMDMIEEALDKLMIVEEQPKLAPVATPVVTGRRRVRRHSDPPVTPQGPGPADTTLHPTEPDNRLLEALYRKLDEAIEPELISMIVDQIRQEEGR